MADNSVFQPQVAQVNSAVTPQQGVADTSAVDLFVDVAQVATDAAFSYTGQKELSDLKSKFDRVVQARQAGGNSTTLQMRARAELDAAKANAPWISQEADELFRTSFGGSSSTGVFAPTPQEKAQADHLEKVNEKALTLGVSVGEAQKRITLEENAKSAKILADSQKEVREYNGDVVFANTNTQLNNMTIKMMDAVNRANVRGGGSISSEGIRSFNLTIDQEVARLKAELNSQVRDPKTGHLLVSKDSYDDNLSAIDEWAQNNKDIVSDNSYQKVLEGINAENVAEINAIANQKYRTLKVLDASGGQAAVKTYLDAAMRPEGAAKELIKNSNPIVKEMFSQQGSFNKAGSEGFDKLILPTPQNINMTEPEAIATGTMLNDPANSTLMISVMDGVGSEASSASAYKSMIQKNPDSSAVVWSQQFRSWSQANQTKAGNVLDTTVEGLRGSFLSAYVLESGNATPDFQIMERVREERRFGRDVTRRNVVVGDGISTESASILSNMLSVFVQNPDYAKKVASDLGVPDANPRELVRAVVIGVPQEAPEGSSQESDTNTPSQSEDLSGFFTEDDISFMVGNGRLTEEQVQTLRNSGAIINAE